MKTLSSLLLVTGIAQAVSPGLRASGPEVAAAGYLPDRHGLAGMFAGVSRQALLCAGGTNFPDQPLAQGGKKVWHGRVFVLESPDGPWQVAGQLPRPNAYGISAVWRDAVIVAGGGDATANFREAWLMRWNGRQLGFEPLPALPVTTANGCGAVVGDILYVAGGQETPNSTRALRRCFALDLTASDRSWREVPWPEAAAGRILAVSGAHGGWFYLISGADLIPGQGSAAERRYLVDAWRYRPEVGWERIADLPHAVAAAPSPAMDDGHQRLVIAGGVSPEFLATLPKSGPHPGFPREILTYKVNSNTWSATTSAGDNPPPRVTAPVVCWKGRYVIPSGEVAPGIRTPTVLTFTFAP